MFIIGHWGWSWTPGVSAMKREGALCYSEGFDASHRNLRRATGARRCFDIHIKMLSASRRAGQRNPPWPWMLPALPYWEGDDDNGDGEGVGIVLISPSGGGSAVIPFRLFTDGTQARNPSISWLSETKAQPDAAKGLAKVFHRRCSGLPPGFPTLRCLFCCSTSAGGASPRTHVTGKGPGPGSEASPPHLGPAPSTWSPEPSTCFHASLLNPARHAEVRAPSTTLGDFWCFADF